MADVGDFGKYGLLRSLCISQLKLGVVWYLVPNESHNNDGKHIGYLELPAIKRAFYRECDTELYESLLAIYRRTARDVKEIKHGTILPEGTAFYEEPLTFAGTKSVERHSIRQHWLSKAIGVTEHCNLIFVDPDNGLQVGVGAYDPKGPKYVFFHELIAFAELNKSLVIYHHICRQGKAIEQINSRLLEIKDKLPNGKSAIALLYHRGSARVFFIVPSPDHEATLFDRVMRFMNSPWSRHFEAVYPKFGS